MAQTAYRAERGMTLIEILFALVLVAITSMALIKSALLAANINVMNEMRDEAVSVAEQRLNDLQNTPFSDPALIATAPAFVSDPTITRNIRGITCSYNVTRMVADINSMSKQLSLGVSWTYKGKQYQHTVSTVLRTQ